MSYLQETLIAILNVLLVGIILGAGAPALYAFSSKLELIAPQLNNFNAIILKIAAKLILVFIAVILIISLLFLLRHSLHSHFGITISFLPK